MTIECFDQYGDSAPDRVGGCRRCSDNDRRDGSKQQKFFKITSTGYDTTAGDGAIRKIEAIYTTAKRTYAPMAYWTPKDIIFTGGGNTTVRKMSFFAGENIQG